MKKALVMGGTGLVGKQLIDLLIADSRYAVTSLVRKKTTMGQEKLLEVEFDFDNPDKSVIVGDEIFCCLGTTIKTAGSKAAFYKVDYSYVLSVAQTAYANGAKKMALISSMGANKNSTVFYNKTKGAIEESVTQIGYETLTILRPSILLGQRADFRLGELIGKFVMTAFAFAIPKKYKAIEARQVAKAMIEATNQGIPGVHILESDRIAAF